MADKYEVDDAKKAEKHDDEEDKDYASRNNDAGYERDDAEKAKKQFVEEGHRAGTIKSLQVYLKPEEYAAAIEKLLKDKAYRMSMSASAKEFLAKEFNLETNMKMFIDLIGELLE